VISIDSIYKLIVMSGSSGKAPYYYGELKKDNHPINSTINSTINNTINNAINNTINNTINNNETQQSLTQTINDTIAVNPAPEDCPSSCSSLSLSRPSSSNLMSSSQSHYGMANVSASNNNSNSNTIASFANPLLTIEADTRHGSESLPRTFQSQKKPNLFQKSNQKQGIYQRSLSLFANGVSPLLRKKSPIRLITTQHLLIM
jgi:hypothetical protein